MCTKPGYGEMHKQSSRKILVGLFSKSAWSLFLFGERLLDLNTQLCFLIYIFSVAFLNIR